MSRRLLENGSGRLLEGTVGNRLLEGAGAAPQTFRQALYAKLTAIPELTALVGTAIYPGKLPETHELGRDGPALTYTIITYPRGHVLTGSDGTATARVQLSAWAHQMSASDAVTLAVWNAIDGIPVNPWGNGTVPIMSVVQIGEHEEFNPPKAGSDQWVYQIVSEYSIKHRVAIPNTGWSPPVNQIGSFSLLGML